MNDWDDWQIDHCKRCGTEVYIAENEQGTRMQLDPACKVYAQERKPEGPEIFFALDARAFVRHGDVCRKPNEAP